MAHTATMTGDLDGARFDVVVIGGGINGASAAREPAAAGHDVLLAEKDGFAAGASGRSTRMLHCGLRYFETPRPLRDFLYHPARLRTALPWRGPRWRRGRNWRAPPPRD